jgi:hypothetical protein
MTFNIALLRHFAGLEKSAAAPFVMMHINQRGDQVWQIDHSHAQRFKKANIQHRQ